MKISIEEATEALVVVQDRIQNSSTLRKFVTDQTDSLRIVLVNLQLENTRISEPTGIIPIADVLEKTIQGLHDTVANAIKQDTDLVSKALKILDEFINDNVDSPEEENNNG